MDLCQVKLHFWLFSILNYSAFTRRQLLLACHFSFYAYPHLSISFYVRALSLIKCNKLNFHACATVFILFTYSLCSCFIRSNKIVLCVIEWINDGEVFRIKSAVNQALQCTRKKPLIDWLIRNWWQLRRQANSSLDSNHGLRMSCTNDRMNNRVGEPANEDCVKFLLAANDFMWTIVYSCSPGSRK